MSIIRTSKLHCVKVWQSLRKDATTKTLSQTQIKHIEATNLTNCSVSKNDSRWAQRLQAKIASRQAIIAVLQDKRTRLEFARLTSKNICVSSMGALRLTMLTASKTLCTSHLEECHYQKIQGYAIVNYTLTLPCDRINTIKSAHDTFLVSHWTQMSIACLSSTPCLTISQVNAWPHSKSLAIWLLGRLHPNLAASHVRANAPKHRTGKQAKDARWAIRNISPASEAERDIIEHAVRAIKLASGQWPGDFWDRFWDCTMNPLILEDASQGFWSFFFVLLVLYF